jgi:hypothetical protein
MNNKYNIDEIVNIAYQKYSMLQNDIEIKDLLKFLVEEKINSFIEIGTSLGGTYYCFASIADGLKASIDLPGGKYGGSSWEFCNDRNNKFRRIFDHTLFLLGDSSSDLIRSVLAKEMWNSKVDFLFIDGDHQYEPAKLDYLFYKGFVRPGGWIGFHDINVGPENQNCDIRKLWGEIVGERIEFNCGGNSPGIGLVRNI